jgi:hypothetical protein
MFCGSIACAQTTFEVQTPANDPMAALRLRLDQQSEELRQLRAQIGDLQNSLDAKPPAASFTPTSPGTTNAYSIRHRQDTKWEATGP